MPEQGADILAHFGEDHFFERYQRYKAHIAEWRQQYPRLAEVDLRYDQQVVLQMTPGAPSDQAAASAPESKPAPPKPIARQDAKLAPTPVKHPAVAVKPVKPKDAKPVVSPSHPAGAKTAKPRLSQAEIEKAAARQRAARARAKKHAEAKHAPLHQTRQTTDRPRAAVAAAARQGQ